MRWRRCGPRARASRSAVSGADRLLAELRGSIADERVLEAVRAVPRDVFVPPSSCATRRGRTSRCRSAAARRSPSRWWWRGCASCSRSRGGERVLDVGTGSGYHAALLSRLCAHVYSVELYPELSERAARCLAAAGIANVTLAVGDGCAGLPEHAPYDAINVAAAARRRDPAGARRPARRRRPAGGAGRGRRPAARAAAARRAAAASRPRSSACASCRCRQRHDGLRRGLGRYSRPTFAHGLPSTITTSAVKSLAPRISDEPTP